MIITYAGFTLTDYFLVEKVNRSILPPREVGLLNVPERDGSYFTGMRYGTRTITVDVILPKQATPQALMNAIRYLAFALDIDTPAELIFDDEPTKAYYAILSGETNIDEILNMGKGTLIFTIPDPFAYSTITKSATPVSGLFTIQNDGTTTMYPRFSTTFTQDASFVSYTSPDGIILVGNPAQADVIKLPRTQVILDDQCSSTTGWVSTTTGLDAGFIAGGAIQSASGKLKPNGYGTDTTGWHGPAYRKDFGQTVQDFTLNTWVSLSSVDTDNKDLDGDMLGSIEVYLFDQSGGKVGKVKITDAHVNFEYNFPQVYAGNTALINTYVTPPAGKKVTQKTKDKKGNTVTTTKTVYPTHVGKWNDFYGRFTLQRSGTKWVASVTKINPSTGKYITSTSKTTYSGSLPTNPVAYCVVVFGAYKTYKPMGKIEVDRIQLIKENKQTVIDVESIFKAGDKLTVDTADCSVYLNDAEPFMQYVDVGSTFFPILAGKTEVQVNTDDTSATHLVEFEERFL